MTDVGTDELLTLICAAARRIVHALTAAVGHFGRVSVYGKPPGNTEYFAIDSTATHKKNCDMIQTITLCNVHSYQGINTVQLDPHMQLSSVLGKNGSGKSTFLEALAYVVGARDIANLSQDSFVEIILNDGSNFKRRGRDECYVDGTLCGLSRLRTAASEKFQVHKLDLNENWYQIMGDPQKLMEYVELILTGPDFKSGNFTASLDILQAYRGLVKEEGELALRTSQTKSALAKLRRSFNSLGRAQAVQDKIEMSRGASQKLEAAREIYKASLCTTQIEILDVKRSNLIEELDRAKFIEVRDLHVLRGTSEELKRMKIEQRDLNGRFIEAKERFLLLIEESGRSEMEPNQTSIISELSEIENHIRQSRLRWLNDESECLQAQLEYLSHPLSSQGLLDCECDGFKLQLFYLQKHQQDLRNVRNRLDKLFSSFLDKHESLQKEVFHLRRQGDEIRAKLHRLKKSLANTMASIRVKKTETILYTQDQNFDSSEFVKSLKLTNPQILGTILEFIEVAENSELSPKTLQLILGSITDQSDAFCFIVENDEVAVSLAKKLPCYGSQQLTFLARTSVEPNYEQEPPIPRQILDHCPSSCWLGSLIKAGSLSESHLVRYIASKTMVVPNGTVAQEVFKLWDRDFQIVDHSGKIYKRDNGITRCFPDGDEVPSDTEVNDEATLKNLSQFAQDSECEINKLELQGFESETSQAISEGELSRSHLILKVMEAISSRLSTLMMELNRESKKVQNFWQMALLKSRKLKFPTFHENTLPSQSDLRSRVEISAKHAQSKVDSFKDQSSVTSGLNSKIIDSSYEKAQLKEILRAQHENLVILKQDIRRHELFLLENSAKPQEHSNRIELIEKEFGEVSEAINYYQHEAEQIYSTWRLLTDHDNEENFHFLTSRAIQKFRKANSWTMLGDIKRVLRRLDQEIEDCKNVLFAKTDTTELDAQSRKLAAEILVLERESIELTARHSNALQKLLTLRHHRHTSIRNRLTMLAPTLESIYKGLYSQVGSASAQIYLKFVDEEKPDQGISFYAVPAGKPFRPISQLSGGELSLAIIAFRLAAAKTFGAKALLIDEVDAHLDNTGIRALAHCLARLSRDSTFRCNIFVATHQRKIFNCAGQFVGVLKKNDKSELIVAKDM